MCPAPEHHSIAAALDLAAERLARAGLAAAGREAASLWAALDPGAPRPGDVWLRRDRPAAPALVARFEAAVARRLDGVPFAYAVGRTGFRELELKADRRALIPRPETEGLVDLVLAWRRARGSEGRGGVAADIGTGGGCIALALATEGDFARVVAVERSIGAAALARENVALVAPATAVDVRLGDLLAPLAGERCAVIVSNPPYLTAAEYASLDPLVRDFEPPEALVGGVDGLAPTRALVAGAAAVLEPGGLLALEVDERRAAAVGRLASRHGWRDVTIRRDLFGRSRYVLATARGVRRPEEDA